MKNKSIIKIGIGLIIAISAICFVAFSLNNAFNPQPSSKTLNYTQNIDTIAPAYTLDTEIGRIQPVNAHRYEIVMLYKTGCHTCEYMRKRTFNALSKITTSDPVDIINISVTSDLGKSLVAKYQTKKSPMMFVIDKSTEKITLYYNHVDSNKLSAAIQKNIQSVKE